MNFPPDHPLVERVRGICMAYPEAAEVDLARPLHLPRRQAAVRPRGRRYDDVGAVVFIPDDSERLALLERDDVFVPPYEGAYGWLAIRVEADAGDWELLAELLDTSYRQVALQRQLRALDEGRDAASGLDSP